MGAGVGPNLANGFNNTYLGNFVGTDADDEDGTIRIGDISNGNGAGSLQPATSVVSGTTPSLLATTLL